MPPSPEPPAPAARVLRLAWQRYGAIIAWTGVAYLGIAAAGRLAYAIPRLVRDIETWSALDLKYRYGEVGQWFAGAPVYGVVDGAVYPPASHVILWPFLGWTSLAGARVIWAVTILAAALALAVLAWRLCAPAAPRERLLIAGLAFAAYPLQQSVFVGQVGVHVVAFAAWGAYLCVTGRPRLAADLGAAVLLAASLVKPTLSLPLVAAALIAAGRLRPAVLTAGTYAALTLVAAAAQPDGIVRLFREWLAIAGQRVPFADGVPNLHMLLAAAGLHDWMTPASLATLGLMAAWMAMRRRTDPWLLMGVAGIVARVWAHSTTYDDAFLLLPVIVLFRMLPHTTGRMRRTAVVLLVLAWAALLMPTWAYYDLGSAAAWTIHALQTALWLGILAFLVALAGRSPLGTLPARS